MASADTLNDSCNAFIFNWVKNYDSQVQTLKDALERFDNKVKIYNHLNSRQLEEGIDKLTTTNFELFNYICVIILDNKCEYEQFIQTSDNKNVLLHSEILSRIQKNPILKDKTRLFVIQKLLDVRDMDDDNVDKVTEMVEERCKIETKQVTNSKFGLTISLNAYEYSNNYTGSPFVEVFSRNLKNKADIMPMDKIYKEITKEIKDEHGYDINIEFGSDATPESNLLLGKGISSEILRDFF